MKNIAKNILAAAGAFFILILIISFIAALSTKETPIFGDKVAVINVEGLIMDSADINAQIKGYAERDDVKVVVVRINSPGGGVGASQEIYRELKKLREKKKVVVSMGGVAASGGYYIAAAADSIVANPGTITGSIGVIIEFLNFEELFKKLGLKGYVIKSGKYKDVGSPLREMKGEETELVQAVIDDVHRQFVEAIAEGRKMDVVKVEKYADGRILSGAQAKALGFVDVLGNMTDAIEHGAKLAGIKGKPHVIYPPKKGFFESVFEDSSAKFLGKLATDTRLMYLLPNLAVQGARHGAAQGQP